MQSIVDAPWDNLVTKDNLAAFQAQTDARFARLDARFAQMDARLDTMQARTEATIERASRRQMIWFVSTMFAFNGLLATWFAAFH